MKAKWSSISIAFIFIVIATYLRFSNLNYLPCGLAPGEADAALIASTEGVHAVYDSPDNEPEGFFISTLSFVLSRLGHGTWQVFATSAAIGVVTVVFAGLAVWKHFGRDMAILAVVILATSSWHIALSHEGNRTVTTPFFLSLLLLILPTERSLLGNRPWYFFFVGVAFFLGFYGYLNYRLILAIAVMYVGMYVIRKPTLFFANNLAVKKSTWFVVGAVATLLPLALGYIKFPHVIFARTNQVNILSNNFLQNLQIVINNLYLIMKGFFWEGSTEWHQSLDRLPFLPWYLAGFMGIGVIVSIRWFLQYIQRKPVNYLHALLIPSLVLFLVPGLITDSQPHGARLNGALIPIVILIAVGILQVIKMVFRRTTPWQRYIVISVAIAVGLMGFMVSFGALNRRNLSSQYARDYFCDAPHVAQYLDREIPRLMNDKSSKVTVYITGSWFDLVPYWYYLHKSAMWQSVKDIVPITIEDLQSEKTFLPGDVVILTAFITHNYQRIYTRVTPIYELGDTTIVERLLSGQQEFSLLHQETTNQFAWYPKGKIFSVYRYK